MKQKVGCTPYLELQERQRREKALVDALEMAREFILVQEYRATGGLSGVLTIPPLKISEVMRQIDIALRSPEEKR